MQIRSGMQVVYSLDIGSKRLPKMPNQLLGQHWRFRQEEAKSWHNEIGWRVAQKRPPKPLTKARLHCMRRSRNEPDFDGLVGSFKYVIDARVENRILHDDTPSVITAEYRWTRDTPHGIMVHIEGTDE